MANVLDKVSCGDAYTDAATAGPVWGSNGGYAAVVDNDTYCQIAVKQGRVQDVVYGPEIHVPVGNVVLFPGTVAARFRNYTAGQVAQVSAALFTASEAPVNLAAGGVAPPTAVAGKQIDYVELAAPVTISAVSEATANVIVSGNILVLDGTTIRVEFFTPEADVPADPAGNKLILVLYAGSVSQGYLGSLRMDTASIQIGSSLFVAREFPFPAGPTVFSVRGYRTNANCTVVGGAGVAGGFVPGYMRVVTA